VLVYIKEQVKSSENDAVPSAVKAGAGQENKFLTIYLELPKKFIYLLMVS
jgi:hypothetical protein